MGMYFTGVLGLTGSPQQIAQAAQVDREVHMLEIDSNVYVGFTDTTAQFKLGASQMDGGRTYDFVLPAGEELWVTSDGSGSVRFMVTSVGR